MMWFYIIITLLALTGHAIKYKEPDWNNRVRLYRDILWCDVIYIAFMSFCPALNIISIIMGFGSLTYQLAKMPFWNERVFKPKDENWI